MARVIAAQVPVPRVLEGWIHYFPEEEFNESDARVQIIDILTNYFKENQAKLINLDEVKHRHRVTLNFPFLRGELPVADFETVLRTEPHTVLACLGLAVYQTLLSMNVPFDFGRVNVRLDQFGPLTPIKDLKSNIVEKFIGIRGNVVRVGGVRPLVIGLIFDCRKCGARIPRHFPDGRFSPPTGCQTANCRARQFEPDRSTARTIDFQKIRLQEIMGMEQGADTGRIPRSVECELTEDLVDACIPGDVVTVVGVVKAFKADQAPTSKDKNKSLFLLYLEARAVTNVSSDRVGAAAGSNSSSSAVAAGDGGTAWGGRAEGVAEGVAATAAVAAQPAAVTKSDLQQFSARDLEGIRAVAATPHLFRTIVHSICPAIYGHELVKAGLCLALFGGVQKNIGDRSKLLTRGDPHVLIVGDPGLGKSQMLRALSGVAPRAVYVSGSSSTNAGLTVSMVRDGSDYALEAGALVLADQGICCIDEFDKMSADHQSLFEAMEQQSISIAKAGMVCTLSARTSVIAAANPVGGHYNRGKTVNENLKISGALLSRFDLIFILLDSPDEARDQLLSEHVIALHSGSGKKQAAKVLSEALSRQYGGGFLGASSQMSGSMLDASQQYVSLQDRLRLAAADNDPVPSWLLRKYIAYARKFVRPRLCPEAKAVLRDFYLELRQTSRQSDSTPITTRQLESTIRLTEARARLELREVATEQDARDVVEIIKSSLADILEDEHGQIDFRRGRGSSKSKQAQQFMKALKKQVEKKGGDDVFSEQEMYALAQQIRLAVDNFSEFLDLLNEQGFLLKKGNRRYQVAI